MIKTNPARSKRLRNPGVKTDGTQSMPKDDCLKCLTAIRTLENKCYQMMLALYTLTGVRRQELLGLRWEDIDWEAKTIHIQRAVVYAKGAYEIKATKSRAGNRIIPMCDLLFEVMTANRKESGFVIGRDGDDPEKPVTYDRAYRRMHKGMFEAINMPEQSARVFRTTYATMQAASGGMDVKTLQAIMGHSKATTTLDVYAKLEQTRLPEVRSNITGFLQIA